MSNGSGDDTDSGFVGLHRETDIDFLGGEKAFDLVLPCLGQAEVEAGQLEFDASEQGGQVLALHEFGGSDTQSLLSSSSEGGLQARQSAEKGLDVGKEVVALWGELKGTTLKQGDTEVGFELQDLGADSRLLNAVRNVAGRCADALMARNIIKQFQMVDVHSGRVVAGGGNGWGISS